MAKKKMSKGLINAYKSIDKRLRSIVKDKDNPDKMDECGYLDTESDYVLFNEFAKELSKKYGYPDTVIKRIWYNMFEFIIEEVNDMPNLDKVTLEEFNKLKTGFNIKSIGKLDVEYKSIINIKNSIIVKDELRRRTIKGIKSTYAKVRDELQEKGELFKYDE